MDKKYIFDPNRIFTPIGIKKTLKKYGSYSPQAQASVQNFSKILLLHILPTSLIIAVHNNHCAGYSIKYYMRGGIYEKDVKTMYLNPEMSLHSFVLVTNKQLFDFFKVKKINVILQDNLKAQNDGSLSYFAGKKNIAYVNVETERRHYKDQYHILTTAQPLRKIYSVHVKTF